MVERYLQVLRTDAPGLEDIATTRQRLAGAFPRNATRRMTQLGMLLGGVLQEITLREEDVVVYCSVYAESRALEDFLVSFPSASPTLFQTSIHPSALQQVLISRQQSVREVFPHTGRSQLVAHALRAAVLNDAPRVILCGGEERGSWLLERGAASDDAFAFAAVLTRDPANAMASVRLSLTDDEEGAFGLPEFFLALHQRQPIERDIAPGLHLSLSWT